MTQIKETIKQIKPRTHVAILLDKSSSMSSIAKFAIDTFNEQVEALQDMSKDQDITVTLANFSHDVDTVYFAEPVDKVELLTEANYQPRGSTALNDAIGLTCQKMLEECEQDENTAFLVIVITDGYENASQVYRGEKAKNLITELKGTEKWTFSYLGANTNPEQVQKDYGFDANNMQLFSADAKGMARGSQQTRSSVSSYMNSRLAGDTFSSNFYGGSNS